MLTAATSESPVSYSYFILNRDKYTYRCVGFFFPRADISCPSHFNHDAKEMPAQCSSCCKQVCSFFQNKLAKKMCCYNHCPHLKQGSLKSVRSAVHVTLPKTVHQINKRSHQLIVYNY